MFCLQVFLGMPGVFWDNSDGLISLLSLLAQDCESLADVLDLLSVRSLELPTPHLTSPIDVSFFTPTRDVVDNDRDHAEQAAKHSTFSLELQARGIVSHGGGAVTTWSVKSSSV